MKKIVWTMMSVLMATACSSTSSSPTAPSTPQPPPVVENPLVTIQLTYDCNPCVNDPDNYALYIDSPAVGSDRWVRNYNPLVVHTVTWTGRLAPGKHTVEAEVHNVPLGGQAIMTFNVRSATTGGVKPNSLAVDVSDGTVPAFEVVTNRCDAVVKPRGRPANWFDTQFSFDVILGATSAVCS